jgi:redox-regulated HSP33 family molecular chaperone
MRRFARYLLVAIVATIVITALVFVWAMQREIDVSTPVARAKQVEAMALGCKLRLLEVLKTAQGGRSLSPNEMNDVCDCAVERVIDTYAVAGKIKPSDVAESEIDAAELACLKEMPTQ